MARSMFISLAAGSALAATITGGVQAQQAAAAAPVRTPAEAAGVIGGTVANGPNETFLNASPVPQLQLSTSSKDQVASLSLHFNLSRPGSSGSLDYSQMSLTASGKLDDQGQANFAGLKGLSTGTEVKLAFTHFGGEFHTLRELPDQVTLAEARCREKQPTGVDCRADYDETDGGGGGFVARYAPDLYPELLKRVLPKPIYFFGLDTSLNQVSFDYLQRSTFTKEHEDHVGLGGSVYAGLLLDHGLASVTAAYTYKPNWDEADEVTLCQPAAGGVQTQCLTSHDGRPSRNDRSILSLELRRAFGGKPRSFARIAVAPEFSYDLSNDAYSVSVPLYLAGDGSGKLNGGIRAVYLNEKSDLGGRHDDLTVSLFVGVPFSVFSH